MAKVRNHKQFLHLSLIVVIAGALFFLFLPDSFPVDGITILGKNLGAYLLSIGIVGAIISWLSSRW